MKTAIFFGRALCNNFFVLCLLLADSHILGKNNNISHTIEKGLFICLPVQNVLVAFVSMYVSVCVCVCVCVHLYTEKGNCLCVCVYCEFGCICGCGVHACVLHVYGVFV